MQLNHSFATGTCLPKLCFTILFAFWPLESVILSRIFIAGGARDLLKYSRVAKLIKDTFQLCFAQK